MRASAQIIDVIYNYMELAGRVDRVNAIKDLACGRWTIGARGWTGPYQRQGWMGAPKVVGFEKLP